MDQFHSFNRLLIEYIRDNDHHQFKSNTKDLPDDVTEFTDLLNDNEKERAVRWCREKNVYLIHKLFTVATKIDSLVFLKRSLTYYKQNHLLDSDNRTWLHMAVLSNRNKTILNFLLVDILIDAEKHDVYQNTALHIACQKLEYNEGELNILIRKSHQLIAPSLDDVTPMELACGDVRKLKEIQRNKNVKLNELLETIDNISNGLPQTEDYYYNDQVPNNKIWSTLLHKNDKYRLINAMRKDMKFKDRYYLSSDEIAHILATCHENGQGILTYVKKKFTKKDNKISSIEEIFTQISNLSLKRRGNRISENGSKVFYKSSLFVALITGRFELVPSLLKYCQFEIIPYAMITCLVCQRFLSVKSFPFQVLKNIEKLKDFCELYAIDVLNRTTIRDSTMKKKSIANFLNESRFMNLTVLDIAYRAKCVRFLGLPSCQDVFHFIWSKRNRKSPLVKFWIHSFSHIVFLGLFAYVLIFLFYSKISIAECFCYVYSFGYLIEELRQIYTLKRSDLMYYYLKNATNILDIGALICTGVGFILRFVFISRISSGLSNETLFNESQDESLFITKLILCFSFILFSMRIIYFGSIFQHLGPKLTMISKMIVHDLLPLIFVFIVFIVAFGVVFQSLLYPNSLYNVRNTTQFDKRPVNSIISDIIRRATFTIFDAHYTINELDDNSGVYAINNNGRIAAYFLLVIYIVVVNVMLMNLLIALFSYTVTVIIEISKESWKAKRYKDIKEYLDRSMLPPPLNIIEMLIEITVSCKREKYKKANKENKTVENIELLNSEKKYTDKTEFSSFEILQAFALRDCRYKLIQTEEDKEYERQMDIKLLYRRLNEKTN